MAWWNALCTPSSRRRWNTSSPTSARRCSNRFVVWWAGRKSIVGKSLPPGSRMTHARMKTASRKRQTTDCRYLKAYVGGAKSDRRSRVRESESTTMFEIRPFVVDQEPDHCGPEPQRGIEVFCSVTVELFSPRRTRPGVHLTSMSKAHHCGQERSRLHRLFLIQLVEFELEVLGQKLTDEDGTSEQSARPHSFTQKRRNVQSAIDDAVRMILGCLNARRRGGRFDSLLDVHEAQVG